MTTRRSWLAGAGALAALQALPARGQGAAGTATQPGAAPSATPAAPTAAARRNRVAFGTGPTRIALLLETLSEPYGKAAQAIVAGVRAAHDVDGQDTSVELLPLAENDPDLQRICQELPARGFAMAIGPLTRGNVNGLADVGTLAVPVLALNLPDADRQVPANLTFFSLAIELEASQLAQVAYSDVRARAAVPGANPADTAPRAVTIGDATPLARRATTAFAQAWSAMGAQPPASVEIDPSDQQAWRTALADSRANVAFIVANPDLLRTIRSVMRADVALYGTSQLSAMQLTAARGPIANELNGVKLLDMPWQLQPDNPVVAAYPRDRNLRHADFQRLYALGIDAFHVGRQVAAGNTSFDLDGVTGRLHVDFAVDLRVSREALVAEYRNGQLSITAP